MKLKGFYLRESGFLRLGADNNLYKLGRYGKKTAEIVVENVDRYFGECTPEGMSFYHTTIGDHENLYLYDTDLVEGWMDLPDDERFVFSGRTIPLP